jgi:large subunit ribosomal protein L25
MVDTAVLVAKTRDGLGSVNCRRLRRRGETPGNVIGHKKPSVAIAVSSEQLSTLLHSGQRLVQCEIDGTVETTMFREVQWDTFAIEIQHFDLVRIDADERVTIHVPIKLRGTAPGDLAGGRLVQPLHELTVDCLAAQMPESIDVKISELEIGQSISVGDLELPSAVNCDMPPETTVVQIIEVVDEEESTEDDGLGPVEPEVIGQKADTDEAE